MADVTRETKETKIELHLNLDDASASSIDTGVPFFDHMLEALSKHGDIGMRLLVQGDENMHHTVEDVGITLGMAIKDSLGDRSGIKRFGNASIPMDDSLATMVLDISGRSYVVFNATITSRVDGMDASLVRHFFESLASNAMMTIHVNAYGTNDHHTIEAIFKAFGVALQDALQPRKGIRSTKGVL
ncbi:MAG TPA: imidazoleglycerol-phosphate dehydratase HisB [Candidatus Acidoferrales bacterium]|nr:imidazoleglycerol-phosphate dehydratase HisB [Candidatus Acidoferrales bacterium]